MPHDRAELHGQVALRHGELLHVCSPPRTDAAVGRPVSSIAGKCHPLMLYLAPLSPYVTPLSAHFSTRLDPAAFGSCVEFPVLY